MGLVLERPWRTQPPAAAALREQLRPYLSASILGGSPIFDGCGPVTTAGGIVRNPGPQGLAWIGDATDNIASATPVVDGSIDTAVDALFTFACVFRKIGTAVDTNHIAGYGSSGGSGGNTLFRIIGGATATMIRLQFQTGSGTIIYNTDSSAASINDGQFHCAIITAPFTASGDVLRYYIDGKTAGTVSRLVGLANTTFNRVSVGGTVRAGAGTTFGGFEVAAFVALRGIIMPEAWCLEASRLPNVWGALFEDRIIDVPEGAAGAGNTIAVPAGSLTLTGFEPTVTATANQVVEVPAGILTLAAQTPTVASSDHQTISVPAGTLTLTANAPTVVATENQLISVPAGALTLTGFEPTVTASDHQTVAVPAGTLTLTGYAPTVAVSDASAIQVPAGSLTLTGFAPTVAVSENNAISVPLGTLTLTGNAPTVVATDPQLIAVPAGTLTLTGYAPTVSNTGVNNLIAVPLGTLTLTGGTPVVRVSTDADVFLDRFAARSRITQSAHFGSRITTQVGLRSSLKD